MALNCYLVFYVFTGYTVRVASGRISLFFREKYLLYKTPLAPSAGLCSFPEPRARSRCAQSRPDSGIENSFTLPLAFLSVVLYISDRHCLICGECSSGSDTQKTQIRGILATFAF